MKRWLAFAILLSLFILVPTVFATDITTCQDLPSGTYRLVNSLQNCATGHYCLRILQNNTYLDLNGYAINVSDCNGISDYGIFGQALLNNITVKNGTINMVSNFTHKATGILIYGAIQNFNISSITCNGNNTWSECFYFANLYFDPNVQKTNFYLTNLNGTYANVGLRIADSWNVSIQNSRFQFNFNPADILIDDSGGNVTRNITGCGNDYGVIKDDLNITVIGFPNISSISKSPCGCIDSNYCNSASDYDFVQSQYYGNNTCGYTFWDLLNCADSCTEIACCVNGDGYCLPHCGPANDTDCGVTTTTTSITTTTGGTSTTIPVNYTCNNMKNCSGYDQSATGIIGATFCGLYNFLICAGPPIVFLVLVGTVALVIVSVFALMYYILAKNN